MTRLTIQNLEASFTNVQLSITKVKNGYMASSNFYNSPIWFKRLKYIKTDMLSGIQQRQDFLSLGEQNCALVCGEAV